MEKGYIYKLIDPTNNECRYIGKTIQKLKVRLYRHLNDIDKSISHKNSWLIGLRDKGLLNDVKIEILEECDLYILNEREVFWISEFKNNGHKLTNLTIGGDVGSMGHKHSDEAKRKISEVSKKMDRSHMRTKEFRDKISKSLIGNNRHKGSKHSEETKKKISESKKGTVSWNAQSVLQLDKEGKVIKEWRSAKYAAEHLGLSQGNIWSVINGNRNKCGGYKWKLK